MKLSTPESPKQKEPRSILLIGPPGGGKSTLMLQFPGLYVLDCDTNLDGPDRHLRQDRNLPIAYKYDTVAITDDGKPVEVYDCYDRLMELLIPAKNNPSIQTVAVDGLSIINEWIVRKILKTQNRAEMEARDYQPLKSNVLGLINRLRSMGKDSILTCHENLITKNDPKNMMITQIIGYKPAVQSKVKDFFGGFFTDMWRCTAERGPISSSNPTGIEFILTPVITAYSELKNSVGLTSEIRNVTYEKLKPYLEVVK